MSSNALLWSLLAFNSAVVLAISAINRRDLGRLTAMRAAAEESRLASDALLKRCREAVESQGGILFAAMAPGAPPCVVVPWRCPACEQANVLVSDAGDVRTGDRIAVDCSGCGEGTAVVLVTSSRVEFLEGAPA